MQSKEFVLQAWYEKNGPIKYTAHRDIINIFYISLIRARLPVCYTEGFSKKPRLAFSPALALGVSSKCEFVNIHLKKEIEISSFLLDTLNSAFPSGIKFFELKYSSGNINDTICSMKSYEYRCRIEAAAEDLSKAAEAAGRKISSILNSESFLVNYNDKMRDIKPYIDSCALVSSGTHEIILKLNTALIAGSSIKPQLVINYIFGECLRESIYCVSIEKLGIIYK